MFDCAAKCTGVSLNDKLLRGPDLMNTLIAVLTRFRKEQIAIVADVEKMYHQVFAHPDHRNALRFLWWPNGMLDQEPAPFQMMVHIFGATSSPTCANFCLRQTAKEFGHLYEPLIFEIIDHNFYVDDCLVSLPSVERAIEIRQNCARFFLSVVFVCENGLRTIRRFWTQYLYLKGLQVPKPMILRALAAKGCSVCLGTPRKIHSSLRQFTKTTFNS